MTYIFINSENDVLVFRAKSESEAITKLRERIEEDGYDMLDVGFGYSPIDDLDEWVEEKFSDYKLKSIRTSWFEKLQNLFK